MNVLDNALKYTAPAGDLIVKTRSGGDFVEISMTNNLESLNLDDLVKSRKMPFSVIPAKAGIQCFQAVLDSRLRGSDDVWDFLRERQP